jgi:hypothetical protein
VCKAFHLRITFSSDCLHLASIISWLHRKKALIAHPEDADSMQDFKHGWKSNVWHTHASTHIHTHAHTVHYASPHTKSAIPSLLIFSLISWLSFGKTTSSVKSGSAAACRNWLSLFASSVHDTHVKCTMRKRSVDFKMSGYAQHVHASALNA